jgi:hypothetical protein
MSSHTFCFCCTILRGAHCIAFALHFFLLLLLLPAGGRVVPRRRLELGARVPADAAQPDPRRHSPRRLAGLRVARQGQQHPGVQGALCVLRTLSVASVRKMLWIDTGCSPVLTTVNPIHCFFFLQ